jgi:hypothetical protein
VDFILAASGRGGRAQGKEKDFLHLLSPDEPADFIPLIVHRFFAGLQAFVETTKI